MEDKTVEYASFSLRLYGAIIDLTIVVLLLQYLIVPVYYSLWGEGSAGLLLKQEVLYLDEQLKSPELSQDERIALQEDFLDWYHNYYIAEGHVFGLVYEQFLQMIPFIIAILFSWFRWQATPGKYLLRMRIVDAKTGNRPTLIQYVVRFAAYIASTLPLCLGFVWALFSDKHQTFHDMIAGTVVIKVSKSSNL